MSYSPIQLDSTPESIRRFTTDRVEPYLRDVRWMLTAPQEPGGPALNMSIACVLCSVIGGLACIFHNEIPGDGKSFQATAGRIPMNDEPPDGITNAVDFARELYTVYRCKLIHSLGLHMDRANSGARWTIDSSNDRYVVARWPNAPRTEQELASLDSLTGRPPSLPAILARSSGKIRLDVDALYRGTRRLVHALSTDPARQSVAVAVLKPWFDSLTNELKASQLATTSTATAVVYSTGVDASLGAELAMPPPSSDQ